MSNCEATVVADLSSFQEALFLRREKRFLAHCQVQDHAPSQGTHLKKTIRKMTSKDVVAHCPNTGSLKTVIFNDQPQKALLTPSQGKLAYRLEALQVPSGAWVGVNTQWPNKVIEVLLQQQSQQQSPFHHLNLWGSPVISYRREYALGDSRIDFFVETQDADLLVEVKNVSMKERNTALFPDAVSARASKHLKVLAQWAQETRTRKRDALALLIYVVQRSDVSKFSTAVTIDPDYAELFSVFQREGALKARALSFDWKLTAEKAQLCYSHELEMET